MRQTLSREQPVHALMRACRRLGVPLTRHALLVEISKQTTSLFERLTCRRLAPASFQPDAVSPAVAGYSFRRHYRCSTSKFGIGQIEHSNCTPLGLHRVAEKIGGGWPPGAVFRGRRMIGFTWQGLPLAPITNRIFWLEGLEPGFNRGGNVDTHARYVYIHGTGDEPTIGRPASHGCIHLATEDLMPLYDFLPSGTLIWITR